MTASNITSQSVAQRFAGNSTIRWSCRRGEYVLWLAADSPFSGRGACSWAVQDFWQLRDGDFLTITNRWADLPSWFELHPLEVSGDAIPQMMKRIQAGYEPREPMDGPNLWRVLAGERLVWVTVDSSEAPVKAILDVRAGALVVGESTAPPSLPTPFFGAPESESLSEDAARAFRAASVAVAGLGAPREFDPEWRFGR